MQDQQNNTQYARTPTLLESNYYLFIPFAKKKQKKTPLAFNSRPAFMTPLTCLTTDGPFKILFSSVINQINTSTFNQTLITHFIQIGF